jgi:hypothetical protein
MADGDDGVDDAAEEVDDTATGKTVIRRMGAVIADESVNAIAILTIGYMAVNGIVSYEPIAAIASIALGAKYISNSRAGK